MLSIILLSLTIVAVVLFMKPEKYLSVTTALPASSYASDKASIFNNNIQQLYPAMGTPDDLDKIVGTAQLDTVYLAVAAAFNLYDHYKVEEQGEAALIKAAYLLKANTKVIKSDFSELKVKVWDTDKNLAPQLANAIMDKLNSIHQDVQNSNNVSILANLKTRLDSLHLEIINVHRNSDSAGMFNKISAEIEKQTATQSEQLQQYLKLINQYQLMVDSKTPVLIIVEKARVSNWPDKPQKLPMLVATFVLSALFSLLLALLLERRKMARL